jgi:hypothetical protein
MMATKVFVKKDKFELHGDSRDIMIPVRNSIGMLEWCKQHDILIERTLGVSEEFLAREMFGVCLWRVRNEKHRMLCALRWS